MFSFDVNSIIQYANIVFISIILLCGIIGFFRGTLKSGYYMVTTLLLLLVGWILMAPISKSLAFINLEKFGIVINDILVKSPMQFLETYISRDMPQFAFLFEEGTFSLDLIQSVVGMGIKVVYFLLFCFHIVSPYNFNCLTIFAA